MPSDTPVLDIIASMTADSLEQSTLPADQLILARIAALAAVDAPAASYLLHVGPAAEVGITIEQVEGLLVAIAPIIGTPRTASAAANIATALGIVIAVVEAELEAELEEELGEG